MTPDGPADRWRVPFSRPTLPPLERVTALYEQSYTCGKVTDGAIVARLEAAVAEYLGVGHVIAVSSGTSGLLLALRALDLSGEVILPSYTFFATGHAVLWNGLTPVFVDCDDKTWNMSVGDVEAKLNEKTCAILGVHLYGNPASIDELSRLATRHRTRLIFDAAAALGARYRGVQVGRFGDAEVFSLSPSKRLVAGEGGFITTSDRVLARRLRAARNHGNDGAYDPVCLGLNARMSEFEAALALAGFENLEAQLGRQQQVAARYRSRLARVPGLSFPSVNPADDSTYTNYTLHVDQDAFGQPRDHLVRELHQRGIETRQYFSPPLHRQRLFEPDSSGSPPHLPTTDWVAGGVISLPCYEALSVETIDRIATEIEQLGTNSSGSSQSTRKEHHAPGDAALRVQVTATAGG